MHAAIGASRQGPPLLQLLSPTLRGALRGGGAHAAAHPGAAPLSSAAASPPNALALIKELRERSGAPISDVKSCLQACAWDAVAAYDALRKKGLAAAAKKASRRAADGLVGLALAPDHSGAAAVEVNSETDFVGRAALFRRLVAEAAAAALPLAARGGGGGGGGGARELSQDELAALKVPSPSTYPDDGGSGAAAGAAPPNSAPPAGTATAAAAAPPPPTPLPDACAEVAARVRENVRLRRGFALPAPPGGAAGGYVHQPAAPGLGRIVAAVALGAPGGRAIPPERLPAAAELAAQLAMHVAGMRPAYLQAGDVPPSVLEAERALLREQAAGSGKPGAVVDKMVAGRLAKWAQEVCLLDQRFILDDTLTVRQVLQQRGAALLGGGGGGGALEVAGFMRVQVGEGLEAAAGGKDFAAEVAEMAAGGA